MPCSHHAVLLKATAQRGRRDGLWAASVRLLPATTRSSTKIVIGSIPISDAGGQYETQRSSWMRKSLLVQGHECLYHLQHKDYDNNLEKDNCWKEKTGEVHAQGKEQATQYFVHYRQAYWWYTFV